MLKITQAQIDKHNELNKRFNAEVGLEPDSYEIVPAEQAQNIGATYGRIYICIEPDGRSHS